MAKISVIIPVYNHEKFVERAIQSVLDQVGDYEIEVFIGEDCSTDNSRNVLKEVQKRCPDNYHFLYRDKNMGAGINSRDLLSRISGDYFIILEGDDFWNYPYKLQRQMDFLEQNRDYILCSHNTNVVNVNSEPIDLAYPDCKDSEYTMYHFRKGLLAGQTAANLYRNYYKLDWFDSNLEKTPFHAGDRKRAFLCVSQSRVHCIQEKWSTYRYVSKGGSSFSANHKRTIGMMETALVFYREMMHFSKSLGNEEGVLAGEELYFLTYFSLLRNSRQYNLMPEMIKEFLKSKNKLYILPYVMSKGRKVKQFEHEKPSKFSI